MKPKIYFTYCPIYLAKYNSDSEIVAIVEVEHNVKEENLFIENYVVPLIIIQNIALATNANIPIPSPRSTANHRKIYTVRFRIRVIHRNIKVLLTRLACLGIIDWTEFCWTDIPWKQNKKSESIYGFYINAKGDYLNIPYDSKIDNHDIDILTNIGNIPIIRLNRLSIKELLISFWKRHISNRNS